MCLSSALACAAWAALVVSRQCPILPPAGAPADPWSPPPLVRPHNRQAKCEFTPIVSTREATFHLLKPVPLHTSLVVEVGGPRNAMQLVAPGGRSCRCTALLLHASHTCLSLGCPVSTAAPPCPRNWLHLQAGQNQGGAGHPVLRGGHAAGAGRGRGGGRAAGGGAGELHSPADQRQRLHLRGAWLLRPAVFGLLAQAAPRPASGKHGRQADACAACSVAAPLPAMLHPAPMAAP